VFTLLWFSLGWFAWSAFVAVVNVVSTLIEIAFEFYALLALLGALVFTGIGVRRRLKARRIGKAGPAAANWLPSDITPPIVLADGPECRFYRSCAAATAGLTPHTKVFDAHGLRLVAAAGGLRVSPADPHGAEELAEILRRWLGYMDAIRESTVDWDLPLLVKASAEHLGYSG
jgi:hypothetical protein